jgi:hypothetical protein
LSRYAPDEVNTDPKRQERLEWIDWTAQLSVAKPYIPQLSDVAEQSYRFGE